MLGWPEKPPRGKLIVVPPEPKKSDYVTDVIKPDNPMKSYKDHKISIEFFVNKYLLTGKEEDGGGNKEISFY